MELLNGLQCREARMLLHWNVRELAYKSGVVAKRISQFELLQNPLYVKEVQLLIDAFKREHVVFTENYGVKRSIPDATGYDGVTPAVLHSSEEVLRRLLSKQSGSGESS